MQTMIAGRELGTGRPHKPITLGAIPRPATNFEAGNSRFIRNVVKPEPKGMGARLGGMGTDPHTGGSASFTFSTEGEVK